MVTATGSLRAIEVELDRALHVREGVGWDERELVVVAEVAGARITTRPDSGAWGALELAGRAFTAEAVLSGFVPEPCGLRVLWGVQRTRRASCARPCLGRELGDHDGLGRRAMKPPGAGRDERRNEYRAARSEPSRSTASNRARPSSVPGLLLAAIPGTAHEHAACERARYLDLVPVTLAPSATAGARAGTCVPTP